MDYQEFLEASRQFRSKLFYPIGKFLLRLKLTANVLTSLSFLLGLIAVYFLFQNHLFFVVFAFLHLLADSLDGVLARLTRSTLFGDYFDHILDQIIVFLLLLKVYFYLNDYYVIIVLLFFTFTTLIYFLSKLKYPVITYRTAGLIFLAFYPLFPTPSYLTFCYLLGGVASLYSLLLQLKYFLRTRNL